MKIWHRIFFITFFALIISLLAGALNWINQFVIVGLAYFIGGLMYKRSFNISRYFYTIIVLIPFILTYFALVFVCKYTHIYPIAILPIFSSSAGVAINYYHEKKSQIRKSILVSFPVALFIVLNGYIGMPNWIEYAFSKKFNAEISVPQICLQDNENSKLCLDENQGKILVLDFWTTSCGICFKKFPELEEIKHHYANEDVEIVAVNLLTRRDHIDSIKALTNRMPYTFKYCFTDKASADSLLEYFNIQGVPNYVIIDKKGKIIHNGRLTTEKSVWINNAYDIIDEALRSE